MVTDLPDSFLKHAGWAIRFKETRMNRWFRNLIPTGNWVLAAMAPVLVFVATGLNRNYMVDFWHHLARGRAIVQQGQIVNEDLFTYTIPGEPLQDANWLSQIIYYCLYSLGGLPFVQLVNSLILTATISLLIYHCWKASGSLRLAGFLGAFTFFGLWQVFTIRPQSFSLLLFVILNLVLEGSDRRRWLLFFPPLILGLWANLHGGFPVGFLPIGCFVLAAVWDAAQAHGWRLFRDARMLALATCLAVSVLATLVNPYGWRVYEYIGVISRVAAGRPIMEWLPPGLNHIIGKVWALSLMLVVAAFAWSPRRPSARDLCLVLCFLPLSCSAVRMVAWWLLIIMPILAAQIAAALPAGWLRNPDAEQPSVVAGLFIAMLGLLVLGSTPGMDRYLPLPQMLGRDRRPEDDLEEIAAKLRSLPHDRGRIFSSYEWGEYLSWTLAPDGFTIFMDARIELYKDPVWDDYWAVVNGKDDWQQILDRYQVSYLLLDELDPYQQKGLLPLVKQSRTWQEIGSKDRIRLFARTPK
jgi:hypothetical protein